MQYHAVPSSTKLGRQARRPTASTVERATPLGNVVVALDGSAAAATAFSVACPLAAQLGTGIEVLHVAAQPQDASRLAELLHIPVPQSRAPVRVTVGDPTDEIIRLADDPSVPLLVLTTHGRETQDTLRLSPIAEAVAARARGPVLLVHPEMASTRSATATLRHFLVPLEGSRTTAAALGPAMELVSRIAAANGVMLDVLHIVHPKQLPLAESESLRPPYYIDQPHHEWPAWRARAMDWLKRCCAALPRESPIRFFVAPAASASQVGEAIAAFAAEYGVDAIVLVRRSHLEGGRGLTLRRLLEASPCPVLLVGAPDETDVPSVAANA